MGVASIVAKALGIGGRTAENGYIKAVGKTTGAGTAGKVAAYGGAAAYASSFVPDKGKAPEKRTEAPRPAPVGDSQPVLAPWGFEVQHADAAAVRKFYEKQQAERAQVLAELDAAIAAEAAAAAKVAPKGAPR